MPRWARKRMAEASAQTTAVRRRASARSAMAGMARPATTRMATPRAV